MQFAVIIAAFLIAFVENSGHNPCKDRKCVPTAWLDEIGCKPIMGKDPCCPESYDCSPYFSPPVNKCNFLGKSYEIGEKIPNHLTSSHCREDCQCRLTKHGFGPDTEVSCRVTRCYQANHSCRYDVKNCCSGIRHCPDNKNNTSCLVNGKLYIKGDRFYGYKNNKPMRCMCLEGFNGKYEEPFCIETKCMVQVNPSKPIEKYCAPVFWENSVCPDYFTCPGDGDGQEIKTIGKPASFKCRFGDRLLNKGDIVVTTVERRGINFTTCKCIVGPYLSCYDHN